MLEDLLNGIKKILFTEEEILDSYTDGDLVAVNVCAVFVLHNLLLTGNKRKLLLFTKKNKYRPMVILEKSGSYIKVLFLSANRKYHLSDSSLFDITKCRFFTEKCFGITSHTNCYIFSKDYTQKFRREKIRYKRVFYLPLKLIIQLERYESLFEFQKLKNICQIEKGDILIKRCAVCDSLYLQEISKYINGEG
jgi:hypothetical protein